MTHGTYTSYKRGCHCDRCKTAYAKQRAKEREVKRRAALQNVRHVAAWTGPVDRATRVQRPAGWPDSVWDRLEVAS